MFNCYPERFLGIRLDRQNELIMSAHRTVAETEEVGLEITNELARNREKILSSRARVRRFSSLILTSSMLCCVGSRVHWYHRFCKANIIGYGTTRCSTTTYTCWISLYICNCHINHHIFRDCWEAHWQVSI